MRRIVPLLVLMAVLVAPSLACATEQRIASGRLYEISTYRGWLLWTDYDGHPVLWRGSARSFDPPGSGVSGVSRPRLGSDARGRTAIVYHRCALRDDRMPWSYHDCEVVEHVLATGADRTLLRAGDSSDIGMRELDQGNLAISVGDYDARVQHSLRLFDPELRERRLSKDPPLSIDMNRGRLAYVAWRPTDREFGEFSVARAVDLRPRRPVYRTLATFDGTSNSRPIGGTYSRFESAATDGRYAYWLRSNWSEYTDRSTFEVWRADLDKPGAALRKVQLEHPATSIAVGGGRIYYTLSNDEVGSGVFEVRDPVWIITGLTTPTDS